MYGNFQILPSPTAEPVAARMNTQRLAQLPWTETLSVDIIETPSQKRSRIVRDSTFVLKHALSRSRH